jgi:dUTP pyrophosphatase
MKIKVFKATSNFLPTVSTPFSAAKDIRADLSLVNKGLIFDCNMGFTHHSVNTGFIEGDMPLYEYRRTEDDKLAIVIKPNGRALIPSGLFVEIPDGYSMDIRPRSGLALKYGMELVNSPGLIDPDYRGDVGVIVKNGGNKPIVIVDGERIAQMKISKDVEFEWEPVHSKLDLSETVRGEGGFNSTGTK